MTDDACGALAGVRVIDLASVVMGPFAAQLLGDMGADVIKVEPPAGDLTRLTHPQRHPGMGALALNVNRNKRGIVLDLKSPDGQEALLKLVATADILLTNMRPGALDRLGLAYERLSMANPRLIYCNAQGFRTDSDLAGLAAYDEIVQASSGFVDLMRRATGEPNYAPSILADKVCALTITYSVLAALVHQRATGRGQRVEVPMTDTLLAFNMIEHMSGQTFEPPMGPTGFNRSMAEPHRAVRTKDGWACILPYTDKNIEAFFAAVNRPDLAADERFQDPAQRARNYSTLYELIERFAVEYTNEEWQRICGERSIPFAPVQELDKAIDNPYFDPMLTVAEHPTEGPYRQVGFPVRFSATPATVRRHSPTLGQHTAEVLAELDVRAADR
ncbi:CaiB/BaiF CoA transferase family protein [Actinocrispum wychmicini]|uniref:Crotonobetainyl-CoA:carnitine CoA-transferase CaiB-like acyl-CoA transferase n=1 Tax=Actinocrispum wychmicini TaxID=1213861 RepID=A0A4R2JER8_9PSEU|nr:CoA transferase [Actinocrispum wychmicini]TCO56702.1 crotonobetainyl-CoA:carnitine CoA-transferase CaiB-like acyl-CoA transferase [Actinocrispum wychmicini]